ncbi:polysaccharide deacetylase family protein [Maribacter sp. 2210JD10-5]|uniref:polysaccharide deacetylase family protein n=1 Tax=Maribacter sp. 2210JD10-5 TaxID=3386272 RepID=UPI0039BCE947
MLRRGPINYITSVLLATLILFYYLNILPLWPSFLIGLIWFLITLCGSFFIRWNYHLTSFHSNKNTPQNHISITFDDGPHQEFTPKILELLKKYNAKATFFCIGQQIEKHPELFQKILDEGHAVGNHTYSHSKSFGFFGAKKVIKELSDTNDLVKEKTGLRMNLYRPAFAVTNPSIEKAVKTLQLHVIGWNVRSLDKTPRTEDMILKRITGTVSKGDIVLLHDTSEKTVRVLERLLLFLERKKLQSVTVDQLLQIKAYA